MKHYKCNQCQQEFELDKFDDEICPKCKSSDIRATKEASKSGNGIITKMSTFIKQNKIITASIIGLILLLIIVTRSCSPETYNVYLQLMPDSCTFSVIVKDGDKVVNPKEFRYSDDGGKTWQSNSVFFKEFEGQFVIKVKLKDSNKKVEFKYLFTNQFNFVPTGNCNNSDTICECKNLQVLSVEQKELNGKLAIIIHSSNQKCGIQYSFKGKDDGYSPDSVFYPSSTDKEVIVYVKTDDCEPVGYNMNPFNITQVALQCPSAQEMTSVFNKFVKNPDTKLMHEILKKFESPSVKITIIGGTFATSPSVDEYFQYLKTSGVNDNVKIRVSYIQCNSLKQIKSISITQTSSATN